MELKLTRLESNALKVVKDWFDTYDFEILEMHKNDNSLEMKVEDLQQPYDDEDRIKNECLDYWCEWFINEIRGKEVEEELEKEWEEKDIKPMQQYLDRNKEEQIMKGSKVAIGKQIVGEFKGECFYENVKWEELENEFYSTVVDKSTLNMTCLLDLMNYIEGNTNEYSDATYDFIKGAIEKELDKYYYFNDNGMFEKRITINMISDKLIEEDIEFKYNDLNDEINISLGEEDHSNLVVAIKDNVYSNLITMIYMSTRFEYPSIDQLVAEIKEYLKNEIDVTVNEDKGTVQFKYEIELKVGETKTGS